MSTLPLPAGHQVIVTGSLQANADDRGVDRSDVQPVSAVDAEGVHPVDFFSDKGELGVSSLVFWDANTIYWSTGDDLNRLDPATGETVPITIDGLVDVHEMTRVGDTIWLANTGADEVVAVRPDDGHAVERVPLAPFRPQRNPGSESIDRFHTNQVVAGPGEQLYALVHHASGRQLLRRIRTRILKTHGDGGVLDLVAREAHDLHLSAPHSVTRVGDQWWVCDSGKAEMAVFSADWERVAATGTAGWGRGASLFEDESILLVGLSPIRSRYRSTISSTQTQVTTAAVQAIDTATRESLAVLPIPGIEQVNNVYLVPSATAAQLRAL